MIHHNVHVIKIGKNVYQVREVDETSQEKGLENVKRRATQGTHNNLEDVLGKVMCRRILIK